MGVGQVVVHTCIRTFPVQEKWRPFFKGFIFLFTHTCVYICVCCVGCREASNM